MPLAYKKIVAAPLIFPTAKGLYCKPGKFHVDPWRPVETAVITHAHSDHAREGSRRYYATESSVPILRHRLGEHCDIVGMPYGKTFKLEKCTLSFHPAGHVLGSAQVRVEHNGEVWVVSGDYKRDPDPTCPEFEPIVCDTFITEATFGLPIYRWSPAPVVAREIHEWWQRNRERGVPSLLGCYALGKAQRLIAELRAYTDDPIYTHGAVESITEIYRRLGVNLGTTIRIDQENRKNLAGELVLAPPSALSAPWGLSFKKAEHAFASGWMRVRGNRRRRGYDRGFILSDHADWPSLLRTVKETRAKKILVTHGSSDILVRYLREQGIDADALQTSYGSEGEDGGENT